ncbi:MAG: YihY/virulence factor BrkB family protein [Hyphomicrobiales bacterium]
MRIGGVPVLGLAKDLFREYKDDDVAGLAAELTYRSFLALFPFLIFLAALGGAIATAFDVQDPAQKFIDLFGDRLPSDAQSVMKTQAEGVINGNHAGLLSVGFVGALWAAMGGAGAMIKGLNRAYDIPDSRPFWRKRLLALGLVLAATIAIFGGVALIFATQFYGQQIADKVGLGGAFRLIIGLGTWPLLLVVLLAIVGFVYWAAPNVGLPFRWVSPGAVFFTVVWLVATVGFGFYVANFSSYNATYGALGGVVVLLLWFYISNLVLLLGAEINALLDEERNGPVLAERRQKVAEAMGQKAKKQPRNPESVGARATGTQPAPAGANAFAATTSGQAEQPPAGGSLQPAGAAARREGAAPAGGLSASVMALVAVIVAALAMRRYAR